MPTLCTCSAAMRSGKGDEEYGRLCTCLAAAKSEGNGSLNGGKPSEINESKLDQLISLLTVLVEQNDQLISIAIQAPEDEDEPGYGLDGLPITYR